MLKKARRKITVGGLSVGPLAKRLINNTLNKNRLTYGDLTIRFEKEFAKVHGARFALFTVSGTSALQVALHTLKSIHGWQDGDEVIVPAVTFVATANVVIQNNLKPVFIDVDSRTFNIDTSKIESAITPKTRCIMPVHLLGLPANMTKIMTIAKKHRLKTLVDSCETMFVTANGKPLGAAGDIVCFSTYSSHLLTTGVGGFMVTQNPVYATKMRSLMNHGRDSVYYNIDQDDNISGNQKLFSMIDRRFSFVDIGYSYRLTELEAAIGIEDLKNLPKSIATRKKVAQYLIENLTSISQDLQFPNIEWVGKSACMMLPIVIRKTSKLKRHDIILYLEKNGIETRYLMPLLNQPAYVKMFGNIENNYSVAHWVNNQGFYIGCHQYLNKEDLKYIIQVFKDFFIELNSA